MDKNQYQTSEANSRHLDAEVSSYFRRRSSWIRLIALVLLIALTPVILVTMLLVRLTSRGPAILRQTRLGKHGQRFQVIKIRTMYSNAEELSGPTLCQPGDSRITPLGRLLRFLHLDELPQLINVVRGEMCLIGPRPERPEIVARHRLIERVPGFAHRLNVLPGITGLAQINLPADQTPDCVVAKVQLDLEYIATASVGLDTRILLCTALRMLGLRHGRGVRLLGVARKVRPVQHQAQGISASHLPERVPLAGVCSANLTASTLAATGNNGVRPMSSAFGGPWEDLHGEGDSSESEAPAELAATRNRPR